MSFKGDLNHYIGLPSLTVDGAHSLIDGDQHHSGCIMKVKGTYLIVSHHGVFEEQQTQNHNKWLPCSYNQTSISVASINYRLE